MHHHNQHHHHAGTAGHSPNLHNNSFVNGHILKEDQNPRVRIIEEKQPAGRDGHSSFLTADKWIIFGGDRHHMPYNDTYVLDLKKLINSPDHQQQQD